jgi:hypothetical protein
MAPMRIPACAQVGVASLVAATCAGSSEPRLSVRAVMPEVAYQEHPFDLVIRGGPFRPSYDIDTSAGRVTNEQGAFTAFLIPTAPGAPRLAVKTLVWRSTEELAATFDEGPPVGVYDVEVRDPRGHAARLEKAFRSLGPDQEAPTITMLEPKTGAIVNADAEVPGAFTADDGLGHLTALSWTATADGIAPISGGCPNPAPQRDTCRFVFVAPRPRAGAVLPLTITVEAMDSQGQASQTVTPVVIGFGPTVTAFTPTEGPTAGGTDLVVTGASFIAGTQVLVGGLPLQPNGGEVVNEHQIRGRTPAREAGLVSVTVRTGGIAVKAGSFQYVARPVIRAVSPVDGPLEGGTAVTVVGNDFRAGATQLWFGTASGRLPLSCPRYVSENRIQGFTPPGAGVISVFATDPVGGEGALDGAFTYRSPGVDESDAALAPPACADGGDTPP